MMSELCSPKEVGFVAHEEKTSQNKKDDNIKKQDKIESLIKDQIKINSDNMETKMLEMQMEQCAETGCYAITLNQCRQCLHYQCKDHLYKIPCYGQFCQHCYKRKRNIIIGCMIGILIIIAFVLLMIHDFEFGS